ncbi:MAG: hypothetical protein ACKO4S_01300 [Snowella sp.]
MARQLLFPQKDQITVIMADAEKQALRSHAQSQGKRVSTLVRELIIDRLASVA